LFILQQNVQMFFFARAEGKETHKED
jgi:hypothetical protein